MALETTTIFRHRETHKRPPADDVGYVFQTLAKRLYAIKDDPTFTAGDFISSLPPDISERKLFRNPMAILKRDGVDNLPSLILPDEKLTTIIRCTPPQTKSPGDYPKALLMQVGQDGAAASFSMGDVKHRNDNRSVHITCGRARTHEGRVSLFGISDFAFTPRGKPILHELEYQNDLRSIASKPNLSRPWKRFWQGLPITTDTWIHTASSSANLPHENWTYDR